MESVICFENIKKSYGNKTVIEGFQWNIEKGEFVTMIGSSGCGKTTILKMINGLILPEEGTVYVNGRDIQTENLIELRRKIGYSIQGSVLFPHMTVEKNIVYVPNLIHKKERNQTKEEIKKWIELMGLEEDILKRYPNELSGGQQQRVGIIRALAASPQILLMDEPFGAVDEITREQLQEEIAKIHKGTGITIVFVTHDIREALKLGTKVLVMDQGRMIQYDKPEKVRDDPANDFVKRLIERSRNGIM